MRILITTGGSPHSDVAVSLGAVLVSATGSPATILTVIKHEWNRLQADLILERSRALLDSALPAPEMRVRVGHAAEEIVAEAEGSYDMIIMGTWPKRNLLSRLLAPTTERVLTQAPCPILIAKEEVKAIHHILLCTSGADSPSSPTLFAARLAALLDSDPRITLLHVMSQMSADPGVREGWQLHADAEELMRGNTPEGRLLREDIRALEKASAHIQPKILHGMVVEEILKEAKRNDYDLIVIGAHRRAGWQRFLLDDLTHQIVAQADRSVLVV
jgi:nucleotide-binding universal stress UspA family protein